MIYELLAALDAKKPIEISSLTLPEVLAVNGNHAGDPANGVRPHVNGQAYALLSLPSSSPAVSLPKERMMSKRASLKGRGPDLLGKGIGLLFGEEDNGPGLTQPMNGMHVGNGASVVRTLTATPSLPNSEAVVDLGGQDLGLDVPPLPFDPPTAPQIPTASENEELPLVVDDGVSLPESASPGMVDAATVVEAPPTTAEGDSLPAQDAGAVSTLPSTETVVEADDITIPASSLEEGIPPEPIVQGDQDGLSGGANMPEQSDPLNPPALDDGFPSLPVDLPQVVVSDEVTPVAGDHPTHPSPQPPALPEAQTEPTTMPEQPIASPGRPESPPTNGTGAKEEVPASAKPETKPVNEPRKVGAPGVVVSGPITTISGTEQEVQTPAQEAAQMLTRPKEALSEAEAREILRRVHQRDLEKLDRDIDKLYDKAVELLSGEDEAVIAFEALRKARQMLLLEPEQVAEVEYLVNRIRSMLTRVEQAATWGPFYGPRILAYQVVWLAILGMFALVTTVPETGFARWIAYWIGVEQGSATVNLITLLLSTLAWGGIGGVTGALWSLHYHVSVVRDFDKAENLWYIEQPILGMVLGGIVYLIMAAGFLVVQVDLTQPNAALGAKLLPAAVAVVAGFRQNMVLDLVDRVVSLLAPSKGKDRATESSTRPTI